jgi:hypothetical protein
MEMVGSIGDKEEVEAGVLNIFPAKEYLPSTKASKPQRVINQTSMDTEDVWNMFPAEEKLIAAEELCAAMDIVIKTLDSRVVIRILGANGFGLKSAPQQTWYQAVKYSISRLPPETEGSINVDKQCRQLANILASCPRTGAWENILDLHGLKWKMPPRRAVKGALVKWAANWVETERSADDSTLFSSSGIWASARLPYVSTFMAIVLYAIAYMELKTVAGVRRDQQSGCLDDDGDNCSSNYVTLIALAVHNIFVATASLCCAAASAQRRKNAAKLSLALGSGAVFVFGWFATVAVQCQCMGQFFLEYPESYAYAWALGAIVVPGGSVILIKKPEWSFYAFFFPAVIGFGGASLSIGLNSSGGSSVFVAASLGIVTIIVFLWAMVYLRRRFKPLRQADALTAHNYASYTAGWKKVCDAPHAHEHLRALRETWTSVMKSAHESPRRQEAGDIEALFLQADLLNPLLQSQAAHWAVACGGKHHEAPVKREGRALQKTWRSYGGRYRQLCDLVRTAVVCETIEQLNACLKVVAADPHVALLKGSDEKMRLALDNNGEASGGYRDLQLSVRLKSPKAMALGIENHIAEIQLHLAALFDLKSDGGHKSYVRARNLRGQ